MALGYYLCVSIKDEYVPLESLDPTKSLVYNIDGKDVFRTLVNIQEEVFCRNS